MNHQINNAVFATLLAVATLFGISASFYFVTGYISASDSCRSSHVAPIESAQSRPSHPNSISIDTPIPSQEISDRFQVVEDSLTSGRLILSNTGEIASQNMPASFATELTPRFDSNDGSRSPAKWEETYAESITQTTPRPFQHVTANPLSNDLKLSNEYVSTNNGSYRSRWRGRPGLLARLRMKMRNLAANLSRRK